MHSLEPTDPAPTLLVACLCAEWCGTCRDYRKVFESLQGEFSNQANFVWVDIEDQAELVGTLDVENFPTLLIAQCVIEPREPRVLEVAFFGPVLPQRPTLLHLIQRAQVTALVGQVDDTVLALAQRLVSRW